MAYIEVHQSLLSHRKTLRLCRVLQMDRFCVAGRLVALWSWAIDNAPEGWVAAGDSDLIADVMGWQGEPSVLCGAMVSAGFLDEAEGAYVLHDWMDYAGRLMEQRKSNAKRQQAWRDRNRPSPSSDEPRHGDVTVTSVLRNGTPYLTVPNHTVTPSEDGEVCGDGEESIFVAAGAAPPDSAAACGVSEPVITSPSAESDNTPISQPNRPALKPVFGQESAPMQLAQYLASGIRSHKPDAKIPRDLQSWAREFDLMLRIDKRPRDAITAVIDFATTNTFWRKVVFSADKLRQKFDTLDCQRQEGESNGTVSGNRRNSPPGRRGPSTVKEPKKFTDEWYEWRDRVHAAERAQRERGLGGTLGSATTATTARAASG